MTKIKLKGGDACVVFREDGSLRVIAPEFEDDEVVPRNVRLAFATMFMMDDLGNAEQILASFESDVLGMRTGDETIQ